MNPQNPGFMQYRPPPYYMRPVPIPIPMRIPSQQLPPPKKVILAAPKPPLPFLHEVRAALATIDFQIQQEKTLLSSYILQKSSMEHAPTQPKEQLTKHDGIIWTNDTHVFVPLSAITDITKQNRQNAKEAHHKSELPDVPYYSSSFQFPLCDDFLTRSLHKSAFYFTNIFWRKMILSEKKIALSHRYYNIYQVWTEQVLAIDAYNVSTHDSEYLWPEEMGEIPTKRQTHPQLVSHCAPDVKMILDPFDQQFYYDMNSYVEDPVTEHVNFKERLSWTADERRIFFQKYNLYPKKFSIIAEYLPQKTVKDLIEFYYVNKAEISAQLKETEVMLKRRGKKKVYAEGTVREESKESE